MLGELPADELELEQARGKLIFSVPELRARFMDQLTATIRMVADAVAERIGRSADEFVVRNFVGAIIGVAMAATVDIAENPDADYLAYLVNVHTAWHPAGPYPPIADMVRSGWMKPGSPT